MKRYAVFSYSEYSGCGGMHDFDNSFADQLSAEEFAECVRDADHVEIWDMEPDRPVCVWEDGGPPGREPEPEASPVPETHDLRFQFVATYLCTVQFKNAPSVNLMEGDLLDFTNWPPAVALGRDFYSWNHVGKTVDLSALGWIIKPGSGARMPLFGQIIPVKRPVTIDGKPERRGKMSLS
jgi:hypothetical protein